MQVERPETLPFMHAQSLEISLPDLIRGSPYFEPDPAKVAPLLIGKSLKIRIWILNLISYGPFTALSWTCQADLHYVPAYFYHNAGHGKISDGKRGGLRASAIVEELRRLGPWYGGRCGVGVCVEGGRGDPIGPREVCEREGAYA